MSNLSEFRSNKWLQIKFYHYYIETKNIDLKEYGYNKIVLMYILISKKDSILINLFQNEVFLFDVKSRNINFSD